MVTDKQFKELQLRFEELKAKYSQMSKDIAAIQMKLDIGVSPRKAVVSEPRKDITRYLFNGEQLNKRQLVLKCVKQVILDKSITDSSQLFEIFPDCIQGSLGVIRRASEAEQYKNARSHYFFEDENIINLGNDYFVVSKDWTAVNIDRFIDVIETIGYHIKPILRN